MKSRDPIAILLASISAAVATPGGLNNIPTDGGQASATLKANFVFSF